MLCVDTMFDGHPWCWEGAATPSSSQDGIDTKKAKGTRWSGEERRLIRISDVVNEVVKQAVPELGRVRFDEVIRGRGSHAAKDEP